MTDIQCDITIMGGREVSRPYRVWFFAEGEWFLSFWRCHRPRWGGRRWWCGVVWLIQASAWNQTCHSANDRCEALASPKGCFLCFYFCPPSIYPLNRKITKFLIQSLSLFTQNKRRLNPNQSPFLLPFVEMEGIEPSSKRGTNKLSTCLVLTWFSSIGRIKTTNLKLIL